MEKRVEILNQLYNSQDENGRLCNSRHGQLEYMTTMHFIHQYLKPESKIIEIGAGTDSILELAENRKDFKMGDRDFNLFFKYHLSCCERRELLAASNHLLYICKKIVINCINTN